MATSVAAELATVGEPHDHVVGFYETDAYLARSVADFLGPASDDVVAIVIATPEHHDVIEAALRSSGIAFPADRYVRLDAATTLDRLLRDGAPDPARFRSVIGDLIGAHARAGRRIHAFGEMVALLWEADDAAGALALEDLWNELAGTWPFRLLCGYPVRAFDDDIDSDGFRSVCDAHATVVPTETYAQLEDPAERARAVALLQQQAVASANANAALQRERAELADALDRATETDRVRREATAMLVHDLRNPAVIISGVLELLQRFGPELDEDEVRQHLDVAVRSASQLERLIDDVLTMSRLESGRFRFDLAPLDLHAVVEEVASQLRRATGHPIDVTAPADLRPVLADEGRQLQILTNLLSNATKFSAPGSPVSVDLQDGGDHLVVRIADRGPGIAADDLPQLFRPFSRLAERRGGATGTGLGLFIARSLVEGQGGSIGVTSTPGHGTTFTYTVPTA